MRADSPSREWEKNPGPAPRCLKYKTYAILLDPSIKSNQYLSFLSLWLGDIYLPTPTCKIAFLFTITSLSWRLHPVKTRFFLCSTRTRFFFETQNLFSSLVDFFFTFILIRTLLCHLSVLLRKILHFPSIVWVLYQPIEPIFQLQLPLTVWLCLSILNVPVGHRLLYIALFLVSHHSSLWLQEQG